MYQSVRLFSLFTAFGVVAFIIFIIMLLNFKDNFTIFEFIKLCLSSISGAGLFFLLVGQTPLFPLLCRLPIVRKVFPPIDGKWTAVLESNWDKIREMKGIPEGVGNSRVEGEVRIVSRLLFVRINFKSTTKYSRSKTVCVSVSRDEQDSTVQLNYIYENDTDDPESTDSSRHNGAGRVTISDDPGGVTMEGTYWTDRKWNEGMNTAGKVSFFRKKP